MVKSGLFHSGQKPVAAFEFAAGMLQEGDGPGMAASLSIDQFDQREKTGFIWKGKSQSRETGEGGLICGQSFRRQLHVGFTPRLNGVIPLELETWLGIKNQVGEWLLTRRQLRKSPPTGQDEVAPALGEFFEHRLKRGRHVRTIGKHQAI